MTLTPSTFMHVKLGKGIATIALHIDPKDDGTKVTASVAFCSPKDHFIKKKGRMIATGRLSSGSVFNFTLVVDKGNFIKDTVHKYFMHKLEGKWLVDPMNSCRVTEVPSWARRAAKKLISK
jgi:hypothetical protein